MSRGVELRAGELCRRVRIARVSAGPESGEPGAGERSGVSEDHGLFDRFFYSLCDSRGDCKYYGFETSIYSGDNSDEMIMSTIVMSSGFGGDIYLS